MKAKIRFVNLLYLHVFRLRESGEETNPRVRAFFSKFGWSELSYRSQCYYKTLKQTGL